MSEEEYGKQTASVAKQARSGPYTTKDFQLDVLGQLAEMQALTKTLQESLTTEMRKNQEQRKLLRFDGRTLVAVGAIALSLTGYMLQDARNSSRRDSEIETTKARVTALEGIAATNTEGRIRTEVELGQLRDGQAEIKALIEAHDLSTRRTQQRAMTGGTGAAANRGR
ncbi:MAG TPA: hypothetical protein VMX38_23895 [Verrucomicrobiae bacterium]|jgi:hypothetical protein|nr:hypothetical protein [Verrucomicrobiae bacterium]